MIMRMLILKIIRYWENKVVIWHGHGGYSEKTHSFIATGTILDKNAFLYDVEYYIKTLDILMNILMAN